MPQQVIVGGDGSVRVVEAGPVGPPGFAVYQGQTFTGTNANTTYVQAMINAKQHGDFDDDAEAAMTTFVNAPQPFSVTSRIVLVNAGNDLSGVYVGGTSVEAALSEDTENYHPMLRVGNLEGDAYIASYLIDTADLGASVVGTWFSSSTAGEWSAPVRLDTSGSSADPEALYANVLINVTDHGVFDEDAQTLLAGALAAPSVNPPTYTVAIVNAGPDLSGLYRGATPHEDVGDPDLYQPMVRVGDISAKTIFAGASVDFPSFVTTFGMFVTTYSPTDESWPTALRLDDVEPAPQLPPTPNVISDADYELVLADAEGLIEFNLEDGPHTCTIPENSDVAFPVGTRIQVVQSGSNVVHFIPAGAATMDGKLAAEYTNGQWSVGWLLQDAVDHWVLYGDVTD